MGANGFSVSLTKLRIHSDIRKMQSGPYRTVPQIRARLTRSVHCLLFCVPSPLASAQSGVAGAELLRASLYLYDHVPHRRHTPASCKVCIIERSISHLPHCEPSVTQLGGTRQLLD